MKAELVRDRQGSGNGFRDIPMSISSRGKQKHRHASMSKDTRILRAWIPNVLRLRKQKSRRD